MQRPSLAVALFLCVASYPVEAGQTYAAAGSTVTAAPHVALGRVTAVHSQLGTNRFGDQLILSTVRVGTEEVLKGTVPAAFEMIVEGGTVGDLTLAVSDVPVLKVGDHAVFLLSRGTDGRFDAFDRARAVLPLDNSGRVKGEALTLDQIRRLCGVKLPR